MFRLALILVFPFLLISQPLVYKPHAIGFTYQNLPNGFAGGIDNPRFQFCDLDYDGDEDLFMVDKEMHLIYYEFKNNKFVLNENNNFGLIIGTWFALCDIDSDNDYDFITNSSLADVLLFKNIGTRSNPKFETLWTILKDTLGNTLKSEPFSMPTFADIDGDKDYDFFTGSSAGQITFYQNIGTAQNYKFKYITDKFQDINLQGPAVNKSNQIKHGASALEFYDADSNSTLDLFWGDYFNKSLYYLKNIGTTTNPKIILSDSTYPKPDSIQTMGFNHVQHVDINSDGKKDLMVGALFPTQNSESFIYYRNTQTNKNPSYELVTKEFLQMIDVGSRCTPISFDIDNDGDFDFLLGAEDGSINYLKNIGTKSLPQFIFESNLKLHLPSTYYTIPTVGDLNNDGIAELIIGNYFGTLLSYQIRTTPQVEFVKINFQLDTLDVGQESAPLIVDLNKDNLLDILVGSSAGKLFYFQNIGSLTNPKYERKTFSLDTLSLTYSVSPSSADWNEDGKIDLIITTGNGKLLLFLNTSSNNNLQFTYTKSVFDSITIYPRNVNLNNLINKYYDHQYFTQYSAKSNLCDIDNDGDVDLFIGSVKGGIYYFQNQKIISEMKNNSEIVNNYIVTQNYPNPFNSQTKINFHLTEKSEIIFHLYNILGQNILAKPLGNYEKGENSFIFSNREINSGVYFYKIIAKSNNNTFQSKIKTLHLIK